MEKDFAGDFSLPQYQDPNVLQAFWRGSSITTLTVRNTRRVHPLVIAHCFAYHSFHTFTRKAAHRHSVVFSRFGKSGDGDVLMVETCNVGREIRTKKQSHSFATTYTITNSLYRKATTKRDVEHDERCDDKHANFVTKISLTSTLKIPRRLAMSSNAL